MELDKNYTLEQLEMWIDEAINSEATPEEIYNCVRSTIVQKITHHSIYLKNSKDLLTLLSGNRTRYELPRRYKVGKDMDIL
tara:strand:+ start:216 stop:458 length:243 start_codon:yes stop_codon:yes gene_type:complete